MNDIQKQGAPIPNWKSRKVLLFGLLVLVCAGAVARLGGSIYSFYKFRRAYLALRSAASRVKNTANLTELPDVDFSQLTVKQKLEARQRLDTESCTCGCKMTLTDCRVNDSSCPVSKALAAAVVEQVRTGKSKSIASQPAAR